MFQAQLNVVTLVTILGVFSVQAQSNQLKICQTAAGMPNVNATLFKGQWFEQERAPAANVSCVRVNVNVINNQTQLNITSNYSPTSSGLIMNKYDSTIVNISSVDANSDINVTDSTSNVTYKILGTDYTSYLFVCGFTNYTDNSTSFATLLTRQQMPNSTWFMQLKNNASQVISALNSSTAGNIKQSKSCHPNSASTAVPTLAAFFAAFYALLKITY